MRFVSLVCVFLALFAMVSMAQSDKTVSMSMDMSSAADAEAEFLGLVQHDPQLAGEVANLGDVYCSACTTVANTVISKGCKYACKALPNPIASAICSWIVGKANLCARILDWALKGNGATAICKKVGFCNGSCQCGVCTPAIAGSDGRCLGAIRSCGNPYYKLTLMDMFALEAPEARNFETLASAEQLAEDPESLGFCLRGRCEKPDSYGCCLTCL